MISDTDAIEFISTCQSFLYEAPEKSTSEERLRIYSGYVWKASKQIRRIQLASDLRAYHPRIHQLLSEATESYAALLATALKSDTTTDAEIMGIMFEMQSHLQEIQALIDAELLIIRAEGNSRSAD